MNWRTLVFKAMEKTGDTWGNIIHCTLTESELFAEFDNDLGVPKSRPFMAWTRKWVYFPAVNDEEEQIHFVPRHPEHFGVGPPE